MIKKILFSAIVAFSMITFPAAAQTSQNEGPQKPNREAMMFKGMNLSEKQKEQIKELNAKVRQENKAKADRMKEEKKARKEEAKETKKAMRQQKEAEKREYLKELKNILGNDNYVIFLENQFVMKSKMQGSKPHGLKDRACKLSKKGKDGKSCEGKEMSRLSKKHSKKGEIKNKKFPKHAKLA